MGSQGEFQGPESKLIGQHRAFGRRTGREHTFFSPVVIIVGRFFLWCRAEWTQSPGRGLPEGTLFRFVSGQIRARPGRSPWGARSPSTSSGLLDTTSGSSTLFLRLPPDASNGRSFPFPCQERPYHRPKARLVGCRDTSRPFVLSFLRKGRPPGFFFHPAPSPSGSETLRIFFPVKPFQGSRDKMPHERRFRRLLSEMKGPVHWSFPSARIFFTPPLGGLSTKPRSAPPFPFHRISLSAPHGSSARMA